MHNQWSSSNNIYLEKIAARYPVWFEQVPKISEYNKRIKEFSARIAGLRKTRKLLLTSNAFVPSTKRLNNA